MREHLATLLDDFRLHAKETAIVRHQGNRRRTTTYGELAHLAGRFASLLAERGIGSGDRVLLWGENSAEWIAAFYGCMIRGVLAVPLDAAGAADFAQRVAADTQAKLAVGDAALVSQLSAATPHILFEDWPQALPATEAAVIAGLSKDTPLQILFTSGTTGEPKGVVITHGNVLASIGPIEQGAQPYMRYERIIHPLRILHTLPLSHVFGQTMGLWIPPIFTAELHFESRLVAPRLIQTIKRERISVLAAVPRILAMLKAHLEAEDPGLLDALEDAHQKGTKALGRWIRFRKIHRTFGLKFWAFVSGGGALSGPIEQFWNGLGFVLIQGYGMTETTALITLNHPFHVARGTIGKPMAGREVKLSTDGEVLVRGASISTATWSGGQLHKREGDWLSTGDLASKDDDGALKFLGRKSETIVTAAGVNIHPEDLEAALEAQPGLNACAVVAVETASGPEPCAVLACRGDGSEAASAIEAANSTLAGFQKIRRWVLWPEPDLPSTSTGKIRRKVVADELRRMQKAAESGSARDFGAASDWLLSLIAKITGESPKGVGDELRLTEDLLLDSLGRIQLAAAIEQRLGIVAEDGVLDRAETLGQLRQIVAGHTPSANGEIRAEAEPASSSAPDTQTDTQTGTQTSTQTSAQAAEARRGSYIYPTWPWSLPLRWLRNAFIEALERPLVWLLAAPRMTASEEVTEQALLGAAPMLIVANHVSTYDMPLIQYALPGKLRRQMAVAMSGEMLEAYRHFRNPERAASSDAFFLPGRLFYWLITAFFNAFPLPRLRDFQPSFAHAGRAMDAGFSVLVFPEGTRSAAGELARFRPGIGLLARQCGVPVLPVALKGLGELKSQGRGWFRSGRIEVRVGQPIRFTTADSESTITARLHDEIAKLLSE
jgi:long-chain acyl-CoA synthetase